LGDDADSEFSAPRHIGMSHKTKAIKNAENLPLTKEQKPSFDWSFFILDTSYDREIGA
jgi:hypothetical protein